VATLSERRIAVVGLGAIGGSVALSLLEQGIVPAGFTPDRADSLAAASAGVNAGQSIADCCRNAEIVLLAVPLDALGETAREAADSSPDATILHAASLQRAAALGLDPALAPRVLGTHPFAGTHASGFAAARRDMFRGSVVFVERRATSRQREDAESLWRLAGAGRIEYVDAESHDSRMAWMSHTPQLVATALAAALAEAAPAVKAGPGARDTTRLAASDLSVWRPILERAPAETLVALAATRERLAHLEQAVSRGDWEAVATLWEHARAWRLAQEEAGR
jgi:prephenate dehydrogenase